MKKYQLRIVGVNVVGTIGYMLVVGVWVLALAVILGLIFEQSTIVSMQLPQDIVAKPAEAVPLVASIITVIMFAISVFVLVALPYLIGKWSSRCLRWVLRLLRISLTIRNLFLAKIITAAAPLVGFFVVNALVDPTAAFSSLYVIAVAGVTLALLLFGLQLIIAQALRIPERLVW